MWVCIVCGFSNLRYVLNRCRDLFPRQARCPSETLCEDCICDGFDGYCLRWMYSGYAVCSYSTFRLDGPVFPFSSRHAALLLFAHLFLIFKMPIAHQNTQVRAVQAIAPMK